jgi:flagellar P-ring protein FlgI
MKKFFVSYLLMAVTLGLCCNAAWAMRLKDLALIAGQRPNQLIGYGVMVGLDGTGDGGQSTTGPSLVTMLNSLGVAVQPGMNLQAKNAAAVMVTAELPAFARPGNMLDVTVSSMGSARSLRGGTLLMTPLKAANGQIYAQAQGTVVVPGADVSSARSRVTVNQQSSGRIPQGAIVERLAPELEEDGNLEFNFKVADYGQMKRAQAAVEQVVGAGKTVSVDSRTLVVKIPTDPTLRTNTIANLMDLEIEPAKEVAKVVINARTGSVVLNQSVQLSPFAVTHGNLTIRVHSTTLATSRGWVRSIRTADSVSVDPGPPGRIFQVDQGVSLEQVVRALNMLGATPQDLMAILQAMKAAGALHAEVEVM